MKIHTILSILAFAAPALAAPKRKRVFKIYTPQEVGRFESEYDRELKKEPSSSSMSMSMPTMSPTKSPKRPKGETSAPTPAPSPEKEEAIETAAPTTPVAAMTISPVVADITTEPPVVADITTEPPVVADIATEPPVASSVTTAEPSAAPTTSIAEIVTPTPTIGSVDTPVAEITEASPVPTGGVQIDLSPTDEPTDKVTLAPATYAPSPSSNSKSGVQAPEAPSGAMNIRTALPAAVVACAMLFV